MKAEGMTGLRNPAEQPGVGSVTGRIETLLRTTVAVKGSVCRTGPLTGVGRSPDQLRA